MNTLLNILWVIFGGLFMFLLYLISSMALMFTIIGIPFGMQTMKLAKLALWPFGREICDASWPSGCLAGGMNVLWWLIGGIRIAMFHFILGILFFITIIGIPFGQQHFKLAGLAVLPFGNTIN